MGIAEHTRLAYLEAMGIPAWRLRFASPVSLFPAGDDKPEARVSASPLPAGEGLGVRASDPSANPDRPHPNPLPQGEGTLSPLEDRPSGHAANSLPQQEETLSPLPASTSKQEPLPEIALPCQWDELQAQVASCSRCPLHQTRTQTVFGVGDRNADWMVIGEAPGEQEDLQGEPFVGPAGLLLNEMLRAIGLARQQVFIANILKCRPPKNRDPQVNEAASCEGYLRQQIGLIQPKIILAVGRIAAQNLLKTTTPVGKLRGIVHDYQGVPLVVVYHPAYLLRSPLEKRAAFGDLRLALHTYRNNPK